LPAIRRPSAFARSSEGEWQELDLDAWSRVALFIAVTLCTRRNKLAAPVFSIAASTKGFQMTNFRAKGFDSPLQLREHLIELEEESPAEDPSTARADRSAERDIAALRKEVEYLRARLSLIRKEAEGIDAPPSRGERHPWMRIAKTVAMTYLLGRLVQRLRLGAPGAAAVPMIASQIDRRIW
jgi:hypothetical protein